MHLSNNMSMYDTLIFFIVSLLFVILMIFLKIRNNKSELLSSLLMGRTLTLPLFVVTLVSSWYGNVVGATQIAYKYGLYNFLALGTCWYISALIFAYFVSDRLMKFKAITLPEIIGKLHGRSSERTMMVIMIIKTLPIAYVMALVLIITTLFNIPEINAFIIVGLLCVLIGIRSSLKSVIVLDLVQFCTIFLSLATVAYCCYSKFGGYEYLVDNLPAKHLTLIGENSISKVILWFFVAMNITMLSPIFHQRCFAAKSSKTVKIGVTISVIFWMISDLLTTLGGLYARASIGDNHHEHAYLKLMMNVLPAGLTGYTIATIVILSISALDSQVFATKTLIINYFKNNKFLSNFKMNFALSICITTPTVLLAMCLNNDIEKAWLVFESALISSCLLPVFASIYNVKLLTAKQFNVIIMLTFTVIIFVEYYALNKNSTFFLFGLSANFIVILACAIYNKLRSKNL